MKVSKNDGGFSLVEIIVASAIISLSLVSIISLSGQSIGFSNQSLNIYSASTLLEEGAEAVRTIRDNGWSNISSLSTSTVYYPIFSTSTNSWSLSATSSNVGIFTRTVSIASVLRSSTSSIASSGTNDPNTKLITITVSWSEISGTITKTLSFYLTNIFST